MQDAQSPTVREITTLLDAWTPFRLQASYDNSGLLVGRAEAPVRKVLLALDCTEALIAEAVEKDGQALYERCRCAFRSYQYYDVVASNEAKRIALP